jgi:hypothetical protein
MAENKPGENEEPSGEGSNQARNINEAPPLNDAVSGGAGGGGGDDVLFENIPVDSVVLPTVRDLSPLSRVGYNLAIFILVIISAFVLLLSIKIFFTRLESFHEVKMPEMTNFGDPNFEKQLQLMELLQEEKKNYRDFIMQMSQMVLLNLLLPILTAILGYIFGSKAETRESS